MDLTTKPNTHSASSVREASSSAPARALSREAQELETQGPRAHGDPMGTPQPQEAILWKGRPDRALLARTAFHTYKVGGYFALLVAISAALGNVTTAVVCAGLGVMAVAILYGLAAISARTTLYILTDTRLILRIGMAIETRVNLPLKHVQSANLRERGHGFGDIALTLAGERLLGYALLWPHARPWRFASPQPMLRAVPEAKALAALLAKTCAMHAPLEQNLIQINEASVAHADTGTNTGPDAGALEGARA
ncbi:PH domain-containing protein [Erythrobacter sp. SCSIO 43205]|uniref:photosynthetic complex putative assembly protein PuhB n=1 Tax=Erythrobacter sp. SCSIO 43205 TaxID=2779361 RepID=UPI001CAA0DDB|nr:photosynthetic complex putative assembly protein PuhB [Erythrobacter sp. SCSIO 43205]UAB78020.1 PH domain-containing protein [Erythrobacter sp. SCSIO 43205]